MYNPLASGLAAAVVLAMAATANAATITVNSTADPNPGESSICVLRDAITAANTKTATNGCAAGTGNDTIQFSLTGTISIASTLPQVTDTKLTIKGPTSPGIAISGTDLNRVLTVDPAATLDLNNLTVANHIGGVISNSGKLTVSRSTISGDISDDKGGGIANYGMLTVPTAPSPPVFALLAAAAGSIMAVV